MFVRGIDPWWWVPDLTGFPLNDQYWISFLSNVFPYIPVPVYQTNQGPLGAVWSDPLQFNPDGTLPDNLYFDPDQVYRLEIRQGPLATDQLIRVVNNYIPNGNSIVPSSGITEVNQITNPQFALVNFPVTITSPSSLPNPQINYTMAGTYNIAPGWFLVLTGTGSATVTQVISTGAQNLPGSPVPPYYLRFNISGFTTATLQQRFSGNGGIFGNNFVSMSVLAQSESGSAESLTLIYSPSQGTPIQITQAAISSGVFSLIQGSVAIPPENTNLNNVAYVDMQIVLPVFGIVDISDIQVMEQSSELPSFSTSPDTTIESQIDSTFHIYSNSLIMLPKNSILCGWNFPLNPWSFNVLGSTPISVSSQCSYIADQTILYQNAASQVTFGQNVGGDTPYNDLFIQAVASSTDNRFALIQYIDSKSIMPYWNSLVSSLVRAKIVLASGNTTQVRLKIRLIYRNTTPSTIGNTEPIASWAANSDPVFSAGWTAILPINDPAPILSSATGVEVPAMSFDQFRMPPQAATAQMLGIVVYTMDQLGSTSGSLDTVIFDKISLVANPFALDTHPQTFDQCLRECQFYYEKSYPYGIPSTTSNVGINDRFWEMLAFSSGGTISSIPRGFDVVYQDVKRATPTLTIYSPVSGSSNNVYGWLYNGGANVGAASADAAISNWSQSTVGTKSTYYTATNAGSILAPQTLSANFPEAFITYQFVADSRLGRP